MKTAINTLKISALFILILMLFALNIGSCGSDDSDKPGSISGRISTHDGAGLSGATV